MLKVTLVIGIKTNFNQLLGSHVHQKCHYVK